VSRAIALGDWAAIATAKGVGPKTAQRAVLDLKNKAHAVMAMGGTLAEAQGEVEAEGEVIETAAPKVTRSGNGAAQSEALSALGNLGYSPSDAASAVAEASGGAPDADTSELIRAALKLLAPKG
jgi:Holliday junction DNA helicase RuvA